MIAVHPDVLDRIYNWACFDDGAAEIRLDYEFKAGFELKSGVWIPKERYFIKVTQGDEGSWFCMNADKRGAEFNYSDEIEGRFEEVVRETSGPGWPD